MTTQERARRIESYGTAYNQLIEGIKRFPKEMWDVKPSPDDWSIHETIVHITDSEANSYVRCRRFIAEPGETVMAYDENQWMKTLHYDTQSTEDALELFKMLRRNTYYLIKTLPESTWSNTVYHPENGTMTLDDWLDIYERHIPEHLDQMQRVYEAWKESK